LVYFDEWEPSAFPHSLVCWCTIFALNGVASSFAFWHARTDMKEFLYAVEWPFVSTMPHLEKHAYSSRTPRKFDQKILLSKDCRGESTYLICQLSGRCGRHVVLKFHNLGLISCRSWIFGVTGLIILPIYEWLFSVSRPDTPPPQSTDPTLLSIISPIINRWLMYLCVAFNLAHAVYTLDTLDDDLRVMRNSWERRKDRMKAGEDPCGSPSTSSE